MSSSALVSKYIFACLLSGCAQTIRPIFTNVDGKVAHGPRRKPLDFGGDADHVTLAAFCHQPIEHRLGIRDVCV